MLQISHSLFDFAFAEVDQIVSLRNLALRKRKKEIKLSLEIV
jgi:hypothetical protein